jgi:outer membrane protein
MSRLSVSFLFAFAITQADTSQSLAAAQESLWEYGAGYGYVEYLHYPASEQYSYLSLPFPTFQYRGRFLRADDQEGARAFLLKSDLFSFELSGTFNPPLESDKNQSRYKMKDLPALIAIGPQLVIKLSHSLDLKFGWYGAVATDLKQVTFPGSIYEIRLDQLWSKDLSALIDQSQTTGRITLSYKIGSQNYNSLYYDVSAADSTLQRPEYQAHAGPLSIEYSYFQSFDLGRASIYFGTTYSDFSVSANQESPLYRKKQSLTSFVGITYMLGQSEKKSIPVDETQGVINRMQNRKNEPF